MSADEWDWNHESPPAHERDCGFLNPDDPTRRDSELVYMACPGRNPGDQPAGILYNPDDGAEEEYYQADRRLFLEVKNYA